MRTDSRHSGRMNLGNVLRRLRVERGWSQEELAHRCGTTATSISRIETGRHGASDTLATLIARELGLKLYQLVALAENEKALSIPALGKTQSVKEEEAVVGFFRAMPKEQRELYKAIGRSFAKLK